jgi:hypothetical protein
VKLGPDGSEGARRRSPLDDATAEALIAGDTGANGDDLAGLSAFLEEVRALGQGPPPPPSAALGRMLAGQPQPGAGRVLRLVGAGEGVPTDPQAASNGHRRRAGAGVRAEATGRTRPSAGAVARAAVLALVATAGVTGAVAARLLPEPAQRTVSRAIETVTPFEIPETGGGGADEVMSRQGEPFDPRAGDRAAAPADDPTEGGDDRSGDRPPATEGADDPTTPDPTVSGDRSGPPGPSPRPGPAAGSGTTTTAPAPLPAPLPAPSPAPSPAGRDSRGSAPASPAGGRTYTATLTGNTDPARPGDPDGRGRALVTLHLGRELLCVAVTTSAIDPVTSVHLHQTSAASTTPIVTAPAPVADGSPACFSVDRQVLRRLRTDPAGHHVEVHTAEFPDGALRGRLRR